LQRLFSTFANGWPGIGLLLQRLVTGITLLFCGLQSLRLATQPALLGLQIIVIVAGALLLVGFWTPVAGGVIAILELWTAFYHADHWFHVLLATLGATQALVGPGAWSIDARLFGRKHIETPRRPGQS
jgi:putative oxidoreductase